MRLSQVPSGSRVGVYIEQSHYSPTPTDIVFPATLWVDGGYLFLVWKTRPHASDRQEYRNWEIQSQEYPEMYKQGYRYAWAVIDLEICWVDPPSAIGSISDSVKSAPTPTPALPIEAPFDFDAYYGIKRIR